MADDLSRILSADLEDDGDVVIEGTLRPRTLDEYIGQREVKANLSVLLQAARGRGEAADHVLLYGPPGPRQDDPRDDHRARARRERQVHLGPGHRAGRRPRRDPDLARRARRPVHRRDPPPQPGGRGDPLPGDGGLRARRHDRQGPVGALAAPQPQAVHGGRRHDAGRPHQQPAARPVRGDLPARLLHGAGADRDRRSLGGDPRRHDRAGGHPGHRPARARARRASSTGSSSASATTPRSTATATSTRRPRRAAMRAMEIDDEGLDSTDRKLLAAIVQKFASGPVGRRGAGRRPVRGGRDHRGRLRAVPAAARVHRPDAAGPDRHRPRAGAPVRPRLRDPAAATSGAGDARPVGPARRRGPAGDDA